MDTAPLGPAEQPPMPDKELLAGAAVASITPNLGVSVCGSMQDRRAEHLHDDLSARARIGWAVGRKERVTFNRRFFMTEGTANPRPFPGEGNDRVRMNPGEENKAIVRPAGPIDPDVAVLAVHKKRQPEGQPLAVYASYSLHYVG